MTNAIISLRQALPALLIFGIGGGLTLPALASLGMSGATQSDAGLASGLFNTTQQVGAALGVAALSSLAAAHSRSLHASNTGNAAARAAGYHLAFATGTGLTLAAIIVAAAVLRAPRANRDVHRQRGTASALTASSRKSSSAGLPSASIPGSRSAIERAAGDHAGNEGISR